MIARWLGTLAIAALLALDLALPATEIGRRGHEAAVRAEAAGALAAVGRPFPDVTLDRVGGGVLRSAELRGHPTLLVFERSVDW